MYLVKRIVEAIQTSNYNQMSESEIKVLVKKAKRDYGTTNNTLRRLCDHGVLRRDVGICKTTRRPSFLYSIDMDSHDIDTYIIRKEQAAEKYKNRGKVFEFGDEYTLDRTYGEDGPLMIGFGMAPDHLRGKCLVVSDHYEMVTEPGSSGTTIVYFKRKAS